MPSVISVLFHQVAAFSHWCPMVSISLNLCHCRFVSCMGFLLLTRILFIYETYIIPRQDMKNSVSVNRIYKRESDKVQGINTNVEGGWLQNARFFLLFVCFLTCHPF